MYMRPSAKPIAPSGEQNSPGSIERGRGPPSSSRRGSRSRVVVRGAGVGVLVGVGDAVTVAVAVTSGVDVTVTDSVTITDSVGATAAVAGTGAGSPEKASAPMRSPVMKRAAPPNQISPRYDFGAACVP
jgi:hypothetical protein